MPRSESEVMADILARFDKDGDLCRSLDLCDGRRHPRGGEEDRQPSVGEFTR